MPYTLGEAANAAGKAKSTIFKACKDGLISFQRDGRGRFLIEPAELHRVFPPITAERAGERTDEQPQTDDACGSTEEHQSGPQQKNAPQPEPQGANLSS